MLVRLHTCCGLVMQDNSETITKDVLCNIVTGILLTELDINYRSTVDQLAFHEFNHSLILRRL